MLSIRLARTGRKNRPYFRVVVTQKHRDTYGKHIEILGNFDPYHKKETLTLKSERIQYWLGVGAQPTTSVHNMLVEKRILKGKKQRAVTTHKKDQVKKEEQAEGAQKSIQKQPPS